MSRRTPVAGITHARAYLKFLEKHGREPSSRRGADDAEAALAEWISRARHGRVARDALRVLDTERPGWVGAPRPAITVQTWQWIYHLRDARTARARNEAAERWLISQRKQLRAGTINPALANALDEIVGEWRKPLDRNPVAEEWALRVAAFRHRFGHWPRQRSAMPKNDEERRLGAWLHDATGRARAGRLSKTRLAIIEEVLGEGWQVRRRSPTDRTK